MDGYSYDAAGNLLNDGSHTYFYDAENRVIQVDGTLGTWPNNCSGATACYIYDALGRRVEKRASGNTTDYVYDVSGNVVSEFQGGSFSKGYVSFNGALLAQYANGTTYFAHADHLGSRISPALMPITRSPALSSRFFPGAIVVSVRFAKGRIRPQRDAA
jgi:YD repeat-containing protein